MNIKQEFLENVQNYSDDFISIIVGNKLDLLIETEKINNVLNRFLSKNDHLILTSAITHQNIDECFELLIHTFLKKAELMDPDKVPSNTSNLFLELIGKDEINLKNTLINISNLDSALKNYKSKSKVDRESIEKKETKELKYFDFLKQELDKNTNQKINILDQFLINLSELDKAIKHLRKGHFKSVEGLIDNMKKLLITSKNDFEQNIDLMEKLNIEEFELVKIISKTKEEQLNLS